MLCCPMAQSSSDTVLLDLENLYNHIIHHSQDEQIPFSKLFSPIWCSLFIIFHCKKGVFFWSVIVRMYVENAFLSYFCFIFGTFTYIHCVHTLAWQLCQWHVWNLKMYEDIIYGQNWYFWICGTNILCTHFHHFHALLDRFDCRCHYRHYSLPHHTGMISLGGQTSDMKINKFTVVRKKTSIILFYFFYWPKWNMTCRCKLQTFAVRNKESSRSVFRTARLRAVQEVQPHLLYRRNIRRSGWWG